MSGLLPGEPLLQLATHHARHKGMYPWAPKPGDKYARLLEDSLEVLDRYRAHLPLGPRAIMYALLPAWVFERGEYRNKEALRSALSDVLGKARRARIIPFEWIDDQRTALAVPWTVSDLPGVVGALQSDRQAGQPFRVEMWIEARGNLSRIGNICSQYGIAVRSGSGSVPIDAIRKAAIRAINAECPTLLLVVVDFDPAGVKNIAEALEADAKAFVRDLGGDPNNLFVRQIALTQRQAEALPESVREPLTPKDFRETPDWPADWKVEVEAMPPDVLDAAVEDALTEIRDDEAYTAALAAEPGDRIEALQRLLDRLESDGA